MRKGLEEGGLLVGGLQGLSETSSLEISATPEVPGTPRWLPVPGTLWQLPSLGHAESAFLLQARASSEVGVETSKVPSAFRSSPMAPVQLSTSREWESVKYRHLPAFDRSILQCFNVVPQRNSSDTGIHMFTAVTSSLSLPLLPFPPLPHSPAPLPQLPEITSQTTRAQDLDSVSDLGNPN